MTPMCRVAAHCMNLIMVQWSTEGEWFGTRGCDYPNLLDRSRKSYSFLWWVLQAELIILLMILFLVQTDVVNHFKGNRLPYKCYKFDNFGNVERSFKALFCYNLAACSSLKLRRLVFCLVSHLLVSDRFLQILTPPPSSCVSQMRMHSASTHEVHARKSTHAYIC